MIDNESRELLAVHHTGFIVAEAGQICRGDGIRHVAAAALVEACTAVQAGEAFGHDSGC